ncbi:MAG: 1,4-dihydroxy-2-naphthoate polyprenyltransferase [Dehalococcoidia bacterium]|nr:1,4-dihydroxy-2-naphthoate polyprenyltransferase [Dehalococcoidia bacterium]
MTAAAAARPGKVQAWRMATRPPTLTAAIAPVAIGTGVAAAEDGFSVGPALAALIGALCLQVGANFANDVFDFRRGADTAERLGPPRATQMGLLTQREVFTGMWIAFALAALAGVYLVFEAGWPILAAGGASILAAIIYTGGPWPIGYHALGDLFTFVFFGIVAVNGTAYVQTGEITTLSLLASLPAGCTVTAILVVNNLRDIHTDARSGKTTLAVVMGERGTRVWYVALLVAAFVLVVVIAASGEATPYVLVVAGALPTAWRLARAVLAGVEGRELNALLKATARFHLVFGVLLAVGLVLG